MPQMFPLNWIILMLFFIIVFLIFNIINFFNKNFNKNTISWKW